MIEVESMQQGAEQTQPTILQQPSNQPTVMPTSPNARAQIQEAATDIPAPNDDAETDWNRNVETNGSPFRSQPAPTGPPQQARGAGVAQTTQSQPIPESDPRPRYYCQDAYVEPQAHGALPTGYTTHIPGSTYHGDGRGAATAPQNILTSWDASAPAPNRSLFLNSYTSPVPTNQAHMQQQQAPQHQSFPPIEVGNNPDAGKMVNCIEKNKKSEPL